jgi:cysteine-rich repeat protein
MFTWLKNKPKNKLLRLIFALSLVFGLLSFSSAFAVSNDMFAGDAEGFRETVGLSDQSLSVIVGNLINVVLSILGIVLVVLIIYAGFTWMTAGADQDKISKAKRILINAAIGLLIVVSAWAIASFIVSSLNQAVGDGDGSGGGGSGGSGLGGGGTGGLGGGGLESFQVKSIVPSTVISIRNVKVKILFNKDVNLETVTNTNIFVENNGVAVSGTLSQATNRLVEFVPSTPCPEPYQSRFCFDPDSDFTVTVKQAVANTNGDLLDKDYSATFTTGAIVDVEDPNAQILLPSNYQSVGLGDAVNIQAQVTDDSGVAMVDFFANSSSFAPPVMFDTPSKNAVLENAWLVEGALQSNVPLQVKVFDMAGNSGQSSIVRVKIRPGHCFNSRLDADKGETGIDCGGPCGECAGGACVVNEDCNSGFCSGGLCQLPIRISSISPNSGKEGNFMTIRGSNFSIFEEGKSRVWFINPADGQEFEADLACVGSWQNESIVVEVPEFSGLSSDQTNAFIVKVQSNQLCDGVACADNTDNDIGWKGYYVYNASLSLPGLCTIDPKQVLTRTTVGLTGRNLSSVNKIYFGRYVADQDGVQNDQQIDGVLVPNLLPGTVEVTVTTETNQVSNPVYVKILKSESVPEILNISPSSGAVGQYLYIDGKNFGSTIGNVWFENTNVGRVLADVSFPRDCLKDWWKNNFILVKVPNLALGEYNIVIETSQGTSQAYLFTVNNQPLSPGICKVDPLSGPPSTAITIYGDGFGTNPMDLLLDTQSFTEITSWRNQKIEALVPSLPNGRYPIRLLNSAGIYSNSYHFNVQYCTADDQCDEGLLCCSDGTCRNACQAVDMGKAMYQWKFSTGNISFVPKIVESKVCDRNLQSPSPWFNSENACVNAVVSARFNTTMDEASLRSGVKLQNCASDLNCDCDSLHPCIDVATTLSLVDTSESNVDGTVRSMSGFILSPNANLSAGNWYKVTISKNVSSTAGNQMRAAYSWKFKVRDNNSLCAIDRLDVLPLNNILSTGRSFPYNALIRGSSCLLLNPVNYGFSWSMRNNEDGYAEFETESGDAESDNFKNIIGLKITPAGHKVEVMCAVSDGSNTYYNRTPARFVVNEGGGVLQVKQISDCSRNVQSPSPARNNEAVCLNAMLSAQFTAPLNVSGLNNNKIILQQCTGNPSDSATQCNQNISLSIPVSSYLKNENNQVIGFIAQPNNDLLANTWYRVTIKGTGDGLSGFVEIDGVRKNIYLVNDYQWNFKTGTQVCTLDKVLIQPSQAMISSQGGQQSYLASPVAANCNLIRLSNLKWQWTSSQSGLASLNPGTGPVRSVTALGETGTNPLQITVSYEGKQASSNLSIRFAAPKVTYYYPQCNDACLNSTVGVEFSQKMDIANLDLALYKCANESCLDYNSQLISADWVSVGDGESITPEDNRSFVFSYDGNLVLNTYYKVTVKNAFSAGSAKILSNYNVDKNSDGENDAYEFRFKTSMSGNICEINKVTISPSFKQVDSIGAKQDYFAMPTMDKDTCNPRGGTLNPYNFNWEWSSSDNNRTVVSNLSLNSLLPSYCSSNCLFKGSQAKVLLCGNGIIEKGEDCDDSNTRNGDGCSLNCLWEGTVVPKCGNGVLDYGEACDIAISPAGCTDRCLFTGALGAICGNGIVEKGESCDDNNLTDGDGCSSKCLNEGRTVEDGFCGNGLIEDDLGEACDDGNRLNGDGCSDTCLLEGYRNYAVNGEAICGDSIVNSGEPGLLSGARGEACDDGNVVNGDGCSNRCLFEGTAAPFCGNGSIDRGEACDDGNLANGDGCSSRCLLEGNNARVVSCANGVLDAGEDCDDANIYNHDGCNDSCLFEGKSFTAALCGNGVKDYGEACDYAVAGWGTFCSRECLLLGSAVSTASVCGNGTVGEGEACDDGNRFDGDGCSSKCLNEGTKPLDGVAVCGNGVFEYSLGEQCDDANTESGDGCSSKCLMEGNRLDTCGDGKIDVEYFEVCDDGNRVNADGCSAICLNEGSSYRYGSACGDGVIGLGEECDSLGAGLNVSPYQWAEAKKFVPDFSGAKTSTTKIAARDTNSGVTGTADFILQCSYESDEDCADGGFNYGVGTDKCCYQKAIIVDHLPINNEAEVCRNPQIQVLFDGKLNQATLARNVTLLRRLSVSDDMSNCDVSTRYETVEEGHVFCKAERFSLKTSYDQKVIDGEIKDYTLVQFALSDVLEKNSEYYLVYEGKVKTVNGVGIKITEDALNVREVDSDDEGVVNANVYRFITGAEVCKVSQLQILNLNSDDREPFALTVAEFSKRYQVLALDKKGKVVAPVPTVYDWSYNWSVSDTDIANSRAVNDSDRVLIPDKIDVFPNNNGFTYLRAQITVNANLFAYDCANNNECSSNQCVDGKCKDVVKNERKLDVFICANPWPNTRLYVNDFFNFSLRYCRDSSKKKVCVGGVKSGQTCVRNADCFDSGSGITSICEHDVSGNVASLRLSTIIPPVVVQQASGLIREYLFHVVKEKTYCYKADLTVVEEDGKKLECLGDWNSNRCINSESYGGYDGYCLTRLAVNDDDYRATGDVIGLRVFKNLDNLRPRKWYQANIYNSRTVVDKKVDGYPAVSEGKNIYINGVNLVSNDRGDYDFYSNIYLLTYSEGASAETQKIYKQLLDSWYFNMNLYRDASYYSWQSFRNSAHTYKQQLIRDLERLYSFQDINDYLEGYYFSNGYYPKLEAGTLIPGVSYSTWPSWSDELGLSVVDPINAFSSDACPYYFGQCTLANGTFIDNAYCYTDGDCANDDCPSCRCQPILDNLYSQQTCYNSSTMNFDEEKSFFDNPDSHVYRYQVLDEGRNYKFDYHLEYLKHVQFDLEGETTERTLSGVGQCYYSGAWFNDGQKHPAQLFTFCRLGRWVNSCGNGKVESDLGEECESTLNMCNEKFGKQTWYTPQNMVCNGCKWQGVCSNNPSVTCVDNQACNKNYGLAQCEVHPLINQVSVCSGAGVNNGKICESVSDCQTSQGECVSFDQSFSFGRCSLANKTTGNIVWTSNMSCVNDNSCTDYYENYYCQLPASDLICISRQNLLVPMAIDQNDPSRDCERCVVQAGGSCTEEKHCANVYGKTEYPDFYCTSNDQCLSEFGKEFGTCIAVSDGSIQGTCYTQNNDNTGVTCTNAGECQQLFKPICQLLGGAGFDKADCGGYCGDGSIQSGREVCDWAHPDYYSSNNPDDSKIYCSNTCSSSCPSGVNKNVFYQGNSYFLRRYCAGTGSATVDGKACRDNSDCRAMVGDIERQGTCQLDTLYSLNFEAEDGFPSGVNLYLPPCNRLAQGSWSCQSVNTAYLKQGAWCHPDYDEHCVDKNGITGQCVSNNSSVEPPGFMVDITLGNLQAPTVNVIFVIDRSSSMVGGLDPRYLGTGSDVSCGDPLNNSGTSKICEFIDSEGDRNVYTCDINGNPHAECLSAGAACIPRDTRFECAIDALANNSNGAIKNLVDFSTESGIDLNIGAVFFSTTVIPSSAANVTWYNKNNANDLRNYLKAQTASGLTYTHDGFRIAREAFILNDERLAGEDKVPENILVLLTDGEVTSQYKANARVEASTLKDNGVTLYTIAYPNAINDTYLWSSECPADSTLLNPAYPPCVASPEYAFSNASNLTSIYDEIINRLRVTLTTNELSTQLYGGRYLPLPGTYRCRSEAQLLPLNINVNSSLRGNIKVQNLKFNYCP